jgi:DNA polymerase IV
MNNFTASVEFLHHLEIRDKPVVVGGDLDASHGIVLAKNYIAKKSGITT